MKAGLSVVKIGVLLERRGVVVPYGTLTTAPPLSERVSLANPLAGLVPDVRLSGPLPSFP